MQMSNRDIRRLQSIRLYYPFFRSRNQLVGVLEKQIEELMAYALLADVVILPPADIMKSRFWKHNFKTLRTNAHVTALLQNGIVVFTAVDTGVRDVGDIVERYSGMPGKGVPAAKSPVYLRDEMYQRAGYARYLSETVAESATIAAGDKGEVHRLIQAKLDHEGFLGALHTLDLPPRSQRVLEKASLDAYRQGGAMGNAAIMPPESTDDRSLFYSHLYRRDLVGALVRSFRRSAGMDLLDVPPEKFVKLCWSLANFHAHYSELAGDVHHFGARIRRLGTVNRWFWTVSDTALPMLVAEILNKVLLIFTEGSFGLSPGKSSLSIFGAKAASEIAAKRSQFVRRAKDLLDRLSQPRVMQARVSRILDEFETEVRGWRRRELLH